MVYSLVIPNLLRYILFRFMGLVGNYASPKAVELSFKVKVSARFYWHLVLLKSELFSTHCLCFPPLLNIQLCSNGFRELHVISNHFSFLAYFSNRPFSPPHTPLTPSLPLVSHSPPIPWEHLIHYHHFVVEDGRESFSSCFSLRSYHMNS